MDDVYCFFDYDFVIVDLDLNDVVVNDEDKISVGSIGLWFVLGLIGLVLYGSLRCCKN